MVEEDTLNERIEMTPYKTIKEALEGIQKIALSQGGLLFTLVREALTELEKLEGEMVKLRWEIHCLEASRPRT